jgi:threonine/homoserine/homoserine lactone efflux protein
MILDWGILPVFVGVSLVTLVMPGPAVLFVVTRSVDLGRRAGVASALGLGLGIFVHAVAATVGLSALLASSAVAYSVVKYAGAAYRIYLGLRNLVKRKGPGSLQVAAPASRRKLLLQGLVVNVTNPKVALFFLAFLPQFTDPLRGPLVPQLAVLGMLFVVLGTAVDIAYALLAGAAGGWLRRRSAVARVQRYVTGGVYVGLGVFAAVAGDD